MRITTRGRYALRASLDADEPVRADAFGREAAPSISGFWEASVAATVLAALLFGLLLRRVLRRKAEAYGDVRSKG